jgi:hypothetical protein
MKTAIILLSLALNVVVAVALVRRSSHDTPSTSVAPSVKEPANAAPAIAPEPIWTPIAEGKDDTDFVARLRAQGFPPRVIRTLVYLRLRERFVDRFRALNNKDKETPYWRTEPLSFYFTPETLAERRAINREISELAEKLLGPGDADLESDYGRGERIRSFGNIPKEKIPAIQAIEKDYSDLRVQTRAGAKGLILAEDREKLTYLDKEKRADLASLLTAEELDEYDCRTSPTAGDVRGQLRYFDPTEAEFLSLYRAQRDFDVRYGRDNLSGEQADRRRAAQTELTAQIEAALGPQRFAEYQATTDGNYGNTRNFVTAAGLPIETAKGLITIQRDLLRRADSVRNDQSLTAEVRAVQLGALEKEAVERLTATIGAENLELYRRGTGFFWLTKLSPTAKTPTPR